MSYPFPAYSFPADHDTGFYQSGQLSVGTTPKLIVAATANQSGVLISTTAQIYLGGPNVSSTNGFGLASGSLTVPTNGGVINDLYAVAASSATVSYLYPSAGGATNTA